jgi:hypothetical protein
MAIDPYRLPFYVVDLFTNEPDGVAPAPAHISFHLNARNDAEAIMEADQIAAWKRSKVYRIRLSARKRSHDKIIYDSAGVAADSGGAVV